MTREEEKLNDNEQLALKIAEELSEGREFKCDSLDIYKGAMRMAAWKDQHPRKGLWDAEKVKQFLRDNTMFGNHPAVFEEFIKSLIQYMEE